MIETSIVLLPEHWLEDFPDRGPEVVSLGHAVLYGADAERADIVVSDDDEWDDFLCSDHPVDWAELIDPTA